MLFFGISNCLWRPSFNYLKLSRVVLLRCLLSVTILLCIIIPTSDNLSAILFNRNNLEFIAWIGISLAGLILLLLSLKEQASGISCSLLMFSSLIGATVAHYINRDPWPTHLLIIIVVFLIGTILIDPDILRKWRPRKKTYLAIGAALCWAIANIGFKKGIATIGALPFALLQEITVFIASLSFIFIKNRSTKEIWSIKIKEIAYIWPLAIFVVAGIVCTNLSLNKLSLMQFAWVTMTQPVSTLIISKWIQREMISIKQIAGAILLIIGSFICMI